MSKSPLTQAGIAAASLTFTSTHAAHAADVYKGKTIVVTVGFGPGGGYDRYGRLLARHIGRHIPGKPTVVVKNLPGAGSLKSVQYLRTVAPKDGTAIVIFNFGQITRSLVLPSKKIKVDFRDFAWIGSINRDLSVCYVRKGIGGDNLATLAKRPRVNFGLTSVGSASYFNQSMMRGIFGIKLKQIAGYSGSKQKQLAIERHELDGDCGAWSSVPADWLRDKKIDVLLRYSPLKPADMPATIPFAGDIAKTASDKQIIKLLTGASELGRPFIAPKELAKDRLAILRTAFGATMKDTVFTADAKKQRLPVSPIVGKEAVATIKEIYSIPSDVVKKAKLIFKK
ncbi:MAG: tripartite-type tricarboxylate transporter receptor subunit TctC [Alphaproteobacteria bacterium]|jgi:tripartite-type tricarboxylate transporter receptor subunit TctC